MSEGSSPARPAYVTYEWSNSNGYTDTLVYARARVSIRVYMRLSICPNTLLNLRDMELPLTDGSNPARAAYVTYEWSNIEKNAETGRVARARGPLSAYTHLYITLGGCSEVSGRLATYIYNNRGLEIPSG